MKFRKILALFVVAEVFCLVIFVSIPREIAAAEATVLPQTVLDKSWPSPVEPQLSWALIVDQLEHRWQNGKNLLRWDIEGWFGGDYNRIWIRSEAEQRVRKGSDGEVEGQLLYSRVIAPFWELQVGLRHQRLYGSGRDRSRSFFALGAEGLAPYWFELEPSLFVSDRGDVSARLTATYDLLFTQRLILQPRFEISAAAQDVKKFGIGAGVNNVELGARLRYELRREFAPYVGVSWVRKVGETSGIARREGEPVDNSSVVLGVRLWF